MSNLHFVGVATAAFGITESQTGTAWVQLRKYDACWPNDRFPIRKRPLREAPVNDRFWPIPAVAAE
jgi:hypothetical protein